MATYNMGQWRLSPQRKNKKAFSEYTRMLDLSYPPYATSGNVAVGTTAWAVSDVIEMIGIRSDQVVLGVEVEVKKKCSTAGARIQVGYGDDPDRWGTYKITSTGTKDPESDDVENGVANFAPLRFSSSDTIDIKLFNKVVTDGIILLKVYILDNDRINKRR